MWDARNRGMGYALKSYGTTVCVIRPLTGIGTCPTVYDVEVKMNALSATTLRHLKEFLTQTDDIFRGITLAWLRDEVYDGRTVDDGGITRSRKLYAMHEM